MDNKEVKIDNKEVQVLTIHEILNKIQTELNAPKGQKNTFGNYMYRSCEDILSAVKPFLKKYDCILLISDEIVFIGSRYYVQATATIQNSVSFFSVRALAREEETKKGMDGSQITGASSSYARKYALNGLFAIDDTKDNDALNNHNEENQEPVEPVSDAISDKQFNWLNTVFSSEKGSKQLPQFLTAYNVSSLKDLTSSQANDMISQIRKNAK